MEASIVVFMDILRTNCVTSKIFGLGTGLTDYGEGGYKTGGGGACEVLPLRKRGGGAEKVLAMLKGGAQKFRGSFNTGV